MYDSLKPVFLTGKMQDSFFASFALGWVITNGAGLASYPIDTVRRRMMMTSGEAVKYKSSMDAFIQILKKEGAKSLFKGAGALESLVYLVQKPCRSMASDAKTGQFDCGTGIDRLSNLPGNLISGQILNCLSLRDAARTSILSKTWRDIWVMQSQLLFNDDFFIQLLSKRNKKDKETQISEVSRIVSGILLAHSGPISEFHLCIPEDLPYPDSIVWIRNMSKNRVRKLKLEDSI